MPRLNEQNDVLQELQGDSRLFQVVNNNIQFVWTGFCVQISQEDNVEPVALLPPLKQRYNQLFFFFF